MPRPRGKNKPGIGRKLKKVSAARNRGNLFREEAEETGVSITQGHKSLHFIIQERGQGTRNRLKLFATFCLMA